jgi:pimeloyl-ACP methyl ester carboxylesterase
MDQSIRFCTTDDGVRIAYATSGKGPPIVRPGHWLTHLEYDLKSPISRHLLEELSGQHTLVRYDPRGTGMSDRNVDNVSPELWLRDLEAVVNDLELERFSLLGLSQGGPVAIQYAVKHPEKVSHLILYGSFARGRLKRGEAGFTPEMLDALCTIILNGWGSDNDSYRELFSVRYVGSGNREATKWLNELEAISATPEMAARYVRALANIDVVDLLAKVHTPTIVLHCKGDQATPFALGRELAAGIAGARFIQLEGDKHVLLEGEPSTRRLLKEVFAFLGDKRPVVSRGDLRRHVKNWKSLVSHIHHAVEPYYVIAAVGSFVAGAVGFIVSRMR